MQAGFVCTEFVFLCFGMGWGWGLFHCVVSLTLNLVGRVAEGSNNQGEKILCLCVVRDGAYMLVRPLADLFCLVLRPNWTIGGPTSGLTP